jgi:exosortase
MTQGLLDRLRATNEQEIGCRGHIIYALLVLAAFIAAYYDTLFWMYGRFIAPDSYYSHGFLVPAVAGYFIWQQKEHLRTLPITTGWWGLALSLLAVLLHLFGTIIYVFSVSGFSLYLLLIGISIFLCGPAISRAIWFPLAFLSLMFPLPSAVLNAISFPLKMFVAQAGAGIVSALGVSIYREGFNITIPAGTLLVGNPCSGLRSLIAFLALGAVFAYSGPLSAFRKWILFLLTVPIAILSNLIRVPILILVSHYWGLEAAGPETLVHTGSGILVFVLGFMLLFASSRLLESKT